MNAAEEFFLNVEVDLIWSTSAQCALLSGCPTISEHDESLSNVTFNSLLLDSDDVEFDGLGKWSALANGDDVSDLGSTEAWSAVSWQVVVSFLESIVLLDVMKVISSEDDGSAHFSGKDNTPKYILYKRKLLT
jgi:hypothetical protein